MIDSHCHLDHEPLYSNISDVIKRSKENGLKKILTISTNSKSFENIKKIINLDEIIYGSIGIHPHESSNDKMDKKFIVEISQLIKSLMNFCEYEIENINNELSIFVKPKDIQNTLMFLKDNPSLSLDTLIDMTAIDYPNESDRFLIVYNLLSVSKNLRIKVKSRIPENHSVNTISEIFSCANWYE